MVSSFSWLGKGSMEELNNLPMVTLLAYGRAEPKTQDSDSRTWTPKPWIPLSPEALLPGYISLCKSCTYSPNNHALVYSTCFFSVCISFPRPNQISTHNTWKRSVWTAGLWMGDQGWWVTSSALGAARPVLGWLVAPATTACEQH